MRSWPARPSPHGPVSAAFRRRPGRPRPPPVPVHSNPGPPFPARPGAQAGLFRPGPGHKPAFNDGHLRVIRSHLRRAAAYPGAAAYLPPPPPSPVAHPACDEQDVVVVRDQPSTPSPPPAPPRTASPTGPRIHLVPPAFHPPPLHLTPLHRSPIPRIFGETHPSRVHSAVPVFEIDPGVSVPGERRRQTAGERPGFRQNDGSGRPGQKITKTPPFFPFSALPGKPESGPAGARHGNRPDRPAQKKRVGN